MPSPFDQPQVRSGPIGGAFDFLFGPSPQRVEREQEGKQRAIRSQLRQAIVDKAAGGLRPEVAINQVLLENPDFFELDNFQEEIEGALEMLTPQQGPMVKTGEITEKRFENLGELGPEQQRFLGVEKPSETLTNLQKNVNAFLAAPAGSQERKLLGAQLTVGPKIDVMDTFRLRVVDEQVPNSVLENANSISPAMALKALNSARAPDKPNEIELFRRAIVDKDDDALNILTAVIAAKENQTDTIVEALLAASGKAELLGAKKDKAALVHDMILEMRKEGPAKTTPAKVEPPTGGGPQVGKEGGVSKSPRIPDQDAMTQEQVLALTPADVKALSPGDLIAIIGSHKVDLMALPEELKKAFGEAAEAANLRVPE